MKRSNYLIVIPVLLIILVSADMATVKKQSSWDLGTKKVAHVAIVVNDIEATTRTYAEVLGIDPPKIRLGVSPAHYMDKKTEGKAKMAFINLDNITLEFFEPVDGPTAWQDFLDTHGEGMHHLGFWVEGLDDHVKNFASMDMPVIQERSADWGRYCYIDATSGLGIWIELLERSNPE
jgi:catechol 2,3-dioxygenase-like lactoylglutathione lyase family enzyme